MDAYKAWYDAEGGKQQLYVLSGFGYKIMHYKLWKDGIK